MKNHQSILCIFVAIFGAVGCDKQVSQFTTSATPPPAVQVRLASSKNLWATLPIIALNRGFFEEQGLKVEVNFVQAAKLAMDALVGGASDFSTVVETNISYLGFTGNRDVVLVTTICESHDSSVIARKSAGIVQPTDLKGKRLGLLPGTTSQIFAERFLATHGLNLSDVQVMNLQAPAMLAAFTEKAVDAVSIWQPFVTNIAKAGGDDAVVFEDATAYTGLMNIAVRRSWAGEHRREAERFLLGLKKAAIWAQENPADAQALMAKELGLDPALVARIWPQYTFAVRLDREKLEKAIVEEGVWIQKSQPGFADKTIPDYAAGQYVDPSFLHEVK